MSKNKCSFHSLKFVLLFYKLKSPGLTWTPLVFNTGVLWFKDQLASPFSGEHVLSQGIYVVEVG
jgi:hypothetical protein